MVQFGNDELVGFHLGPPVEQYLHDCKLFVGGECASDQRGEYLPNFAGYLVYGLDKKVEAFVIETPY